MRTYEALFALPPDATVATVQKQESQLEDLVKKVGGRVTRKTDWGRRPLGYLVKKYKEAHFLLWDVEVPPQKTSELRRSLELEEGLLKYFIIRKENIPTRSVAQPTALRQGGQQAVTAGKEE